MLHLPHVYWHRRRYRPRVRWLDRWRGFHRVCDHFPEGDVWRAWAGLLLVTVMIDAWPPPGAYPPMPRPFPSPPAAPPMPPEEDDPGDRS